MIRLANINDFTFIEQLEKNTFSSPLSKDFLVSDFLNNELAKYIVYEIDNNVVAYAFFWLSDIVQINNIAVSEYYQNKGIGSLLLEEIINISSNNNLFQIVLDVRVSNVRALNLYYKYNFKEIGIRKNYYSNNEDAIVMLRGEKE